MVKLRYTIVLVFFLLMSGTLKAQVEQQFALAQSYEQGGDMAAALRLYEEIYKSNKAEKYFEPIARIYKQQNRFEELKPIVEERMKTTNSPALLILAGEIYWRLGQVNEANTSWDKCRIDFGKTAKVYLDIANVLTALRQYDKAVNVLLEAKQKFTNDNIVVDYLIRTYTYLGNYSDGFRELLYYYSLTNNLQLAEGRLLGLMTNEDAIEYIDNGFTRELKKEQNNLKLLDFYGWFLRTSKNYDKALDITTQTDIIRKSKGRDIYTFAEQARIDGDYDIAIKAFKRIMDMGNETQYASAAVLRYTITMEEIFFSKNTVNKEEAIRIITSYKSIVKNFPKTEHSELAKLRIAHLEDSIMHNRKEAMEILNSVIETNLNPLYVMKAMNELTDIYFSGGNLKLANANISNMLKKFPDKSKLNAEQKAELNECYYKQAEVLYYMGNMDSALTCYYELASVLDDDIANDALSRITFIEANIDLVKPLNLFAKGEYFQLQQKYDSALINYYDVIKFAGDTPLGEKSITNASVVEVANKNYDNARKLLTDYLTNIVVPLYGDDALYVLGDIAVIQHRSEEAINYYADILTKYPRSVLISNARKKIRELRKG